ARRAMPRPGPRRRQRRGRTASRRLAGGRPRIDTTGVDRQPISSSVLDHRFGASDPYTLGVEEEYMLLDPETWDLVQHIDSMLARVTDEGEFEARINPELMQSVLEITTPVCRTAGEVADHLRSEEHTSELQSLRHLVC